MLIFLYLSAIAVTVGLCFVDSSNMSVAAHAVALGVVRGFLLFSVFYIAFIWLYFRLRKSWQKRYAAEILVIGIVVALSVIGKMLITYFNEVGCLTFVDVPRDAWDNTAKFYYAFYQALGGISFEGLADYELYETWRTMIYAGGSLLAGAVAISILTFSISYEIYSFFSWKSFRGRKRAKIYIFTAVTEDSVTLAHSIDRFNKEEKKKQTFRKCLDDEINIASLRKNWESRKYLSFKEAEQVLCEKSENGADLPPRALVAVYWAARTLKAVVACFPLYVRAFLEYARRHRHIIIFLRTEGEEGFDAKNALHTDIMHSGFLFMSYNPSKKNKSIARFLAIKKSNDFCICEQGKNGNDDVAEKYRENMMRGKVAEVHVFALDWEKDKTSENDNVVAEDIARSAREVFCKGIIRQRVRRFVCEKQALRILKNADDKAVSELRKPVAAKIKATIAEVEELLVNDRDKALGIIRKTLSDRYDLAKTEKLLKKDSDKAIAFLKKKIGEEAEKAVAEIKRLLGTDRERAFVRIKELLEDAKEVETMNGYIAESRKDAFVSVKKLMAKKLVSRVVVNYHYLLSEETDFSNVDMRFDNELAKFRNENFVGAKHVDFLAIAGNEAYDNIGGRKSSGYAAFYGNFKRHFRLNALNEANMAAMLYIKAKGELVRSCPDFYKEEVEGKEYKAMIIGFGLNGQQTLKAAYIFSAAGKFAQQNGSPMPDGADWLKLLKKSPLADYTTQPFNADVYDKNASDLGGLFKMKTPAFDIELPSDREYAARKDGSSGQEPQRRRNVYPYAPVTVRLYQDSAYSDSILKMLDRNLGEAKSDYNLIVIALGDDDSNVSIANALLEDYKHESVQKKEDEIVKRQVFAVNLRDKLNYDRINWCRKDEDDYPGLKVVIFGAAEDMYSYENIVDQSAAKIWNRGYAAIQNAEVLYAGVIEEDIRNVVLGWDCAKAGKYIDVMSTASTDAAQIEIDWMSASRDRMYAMTSSKYASAFSPFAAEYCRILEKKTKRVSDVCLKDVLFETVIRMGAVEHDRWVRFVLSNGYVKSQVKSKHAKTHCDIVPYNQLSSQPNDMINVLNALATEQARNTLDARG